MPFTPAQMTILNFKVEQQNLADLLTGTEREYIPMPTAEKQRADPVHPDSRRAKLCARVLPSNPYFKEYAKQAREVLGLPLDGVERCATTDFLKPLLETQGITIGIDRHITPWLWGAWWLAVHLEPLTQ